jgi:hypothetical protein
LKKAYVILAMTVVAIVAISCAAQFVSRPGRNLQHFLARLASVELGKTRMVDWRSDLQDVALSDVETSCHETSCTSSLRATNGALHRLRLAPLTTVAAGIAFTDGIASDVYVAFVVQGKIQGKSTDDLGVVVHESNERAEACQSEYKLLSAAGMLGQMIARGRQFPWTAVPPPIIARTF